MNSSAPPSRRRRWTRLMLGATILLLSWQVVSHLLFAERSLPDAIASLAPFTDSPKIRFICIERESWESWTEFEQRVIRDLLSERFDPIYIGLDEVPDDAKVYRTRGDDSDPELTYLDGGVLKSLRIEHRGIFLVKMFDSSFYGDMGWRRGRVTFIWILGKWVPYRHGDVIG